MGEGGDWLPGTGLADRVGIALAGKYLDKLPYRTWGLLGDSETAEGSVWEAFETAPHAHLSNLTAIIDVNRLGQRGETMLGGTRSFTAIAPEPLERARRFALRWWL